MVGRHHHGGNDNGIRLTLTRGMVGWIKFLLVMRKRMVDVMQVCDDNKEKDG